MRPLDRADRDGAFAAPLRRVDHEAAPRLDRAAVQHRAIGGEAGLDLEVLKQRVERQPFELGDDVPFWARMSSFHGDVFFDRREDPEETTNLATSQALDAPIEALREAMRAIEAPTLQFERLAL